MGPGGNGMVEVEAEAKKETTESPNMQREESDAMERKREGVVSSQQVPC